MKRGARELRIIGGSLRGRRLRFPADSPIRPTPDRVRETLFNWLSPVIHGARCLDLFAGSGALGLEALSRGASAVTFVDNSRSAIDALRATTATFGIAGAQFVVADAFQYLAGTAGPFDVVFIDPPYDAGLVAPVARALERSGCLAAGALCYVEVARREGLPALPPGWIVHRQGTAGEVGYNLFRIQPTTPP